MKPAVLTAVLAGAVALGALASTSVYSLTAGERAVVLRFGRPVEGVGTAGLHLAWPLVDRVARSDGGELLLQDAPRSVRTADGHALTVGGQMRYRVVDPWRMQIALGDGSAAQTRLQQALASGLADTLIHARADDIVADRDAPSLAAALSEVRRRTAGLGIAVSDVALTSAELSPSDAEAAYARMRALAARQLAEVQADGRRQRQAALAEADRQVGVIRGDAEGEALRIRGEGDAKRMATLGAAYAQDPAFARYFRQIEAYENTLTQGDATLVLSPENAFLKTFADGPGK